MATSPKLGNMTIKRAIKLMDARMAGVAKERDKLDELISEMEGLRENCRTAYDDMQRARDSLSELV